MVRNYKRRTDYGATPQSVYNQAVQEVIDGNMSLRGAARKYEINVMTLQRFKKKLIDPLPASVGWSRRTPKSVYNQAVQDVIDGNMSLREAAKKYEINVRTLQRFKKKLTDPHSIVPASVGWSKRTVFSPEQELDLASYAKQSSRIYFGLSKMDIRNLAFQFGQVNNIKMPENWYNNCCAGEGWLYSFLKRNNDLSLRTPKATRLIKATSFNRHNVKQFFDQLCLLYDGYKFEPHNIYNVDETGVTTVHWPTKIVAVKGTKQFGAITSGERDALVTVALTVSATGNVVPPMLILPCKKPWFLRDAPFGSIRNANQSGWTTGVDFIIYVKHFAKNVKPSIDHPVLLLLENHDFHLNIEVLNFCKSNGIILLSFPPHCSHKLQPLDRTVFRSFKTFTHKFSDSWMRNNHGKPMSIYDIPLILKQALPMAATMSNIQSGFRVSGIWPYNPDILIDEEFSPCYMTDQSQEMNIINTVTSCTGNIDNDIITPIQNPSTSQDINNINTCH